MNSALLIVILIVGLIGYIFVRMILHGGRVGEYFRNAAKIYIWLNKADAGLAAVVAGKVAAPKHRVSMVSELDSQLNACNSIVNEIPETRENIERIECLKSHILEKEWRLTDIITAKNELKNINPQYLKALEKADSSVFRDKYPHLTSANTLQDIINAALKESQCEVEKGIKFMEVMMRISPELIEDSDIAKTKKQLEDDLAKSKRT